ncbi:Cytochrome b561, eukaryote [Metarhizium album ARSEF 1941]|uniref:Cytochrome b561, eukaryote n=1 Tax=Metarhizium album (strain ARSEF 1941) TaxID=1081103 RepID=A0A0B2X816_METAS|nr:Cytochrome b561, eukaryote [Metarhizium album ARSEF 1941]KHO01903.1 Cytochrome b561, eukaryote [Metarhizium album ARSEF 1941]
MASATGIPPRPPARESIVASEAEPLLGKPGDAVLPAGASIMRTLVIGTGILAQLGVIILCADLWAHISSSPLIFFSGHPIAMSIAKFTLTQSVLVQQPISGDTPDQKRVGQYVHAALNLLAFAALVTGIVFIEVNKFRSGSPHFHVAHAFLGVSTLALLAGQYVVGFTMWLTPRLYGGEERAKSLYKYHRYVGYFVLLMLLATVVSAIFTDYVQSVLRLSFWTTSLGAVFVVMGVFPRIQKQKMGLRHPRNERPVNDSDSATD